MPQEPDRKIEELLKAYGKKRREDVGAPLEMHAATRKLLQAEVAHLRPKPASGSASWFQLLIQFWPRIGFAVSIVIALGVVVWMLGLENRRSTEFAQAARQPATETSSPDKAQDQDLALKLETLDRFSAPERNAKPTDRLERVLEEPRGVRPGEAPAVVADEMIRAEADASKRFDKQVKLKEAAGAKSDQQPASRDQPANGRSLSAPAPLAQTLTGGGGLGGGAAQNRLGESRAGDNPPMPDPKATRVDDLGLLPAPPAATNAVVAYSINGVPTIGGAYSVQDSSGFSNALFGNVANYYVFQPAAPIDISTNLSLFADSRANARNSYFRQNQSGAWNEPSILNKKVPELRAAEPGNLSLARSEQRVKQQPESAKELSARFGVDKDRDGLAPSGQGANVRGTNWHFVAEGLQPLQAGKEAETAATASSTEPLTERLRSYRVVTKAGASGPLAASTVLNSFQMDLNGDRIRLTDADGSVYEGQLAARNEEWARKAGEVKVVREAVKRLEDDEKKQESLESLSAVTGYDANMGPAPFRVSGTNRSLNQLVVIEAVLSAPAQDRHDAASREAAARLHTRDPAAATVAPAPTATPAPTISAPTSAVAAQKPPAAPTAARQSVITPTTRIQGKARIGGTNEISINAIRVAP